MKNYLLIFLTSLASQLSAQTYCNSFDSCVISDAHTRDHAFDVLGNGHAGCLSDWEVTNGTPSIWRNTDGQGNAYDGTQMILEGVSGDGVNSEGVALVYNFMAGHAYTVTLARRNSIANTFINIHYVLLDSSLGYTYNYNVGGSPTPAIPTGALVAYTDTNLASQAWQVVSFTTPVLSKNYTRLWFRADYSSAQQTAYLLIDSVCVTETQVPDYCMSFDSCDISDTHTRDHAFDVLGNGHPGCLSDWEVTNGTPSIWRNTDGQGNAYDGTQMILEGVSGDGVNSEGVALKYNFLAGQTYTISLARRNSIAATFINLNYVLLDSSLGYAYNYNVGGSPTPAIPAGALVAYADTNIASQPWQVVSFTTPLLTKSYTRLWFRADYPTAQQTAYMLIDSVCIRGNSSPAPVEPLTNFATPVLFQNTSNPFSDETIISYYIPQGAAQIGYIQIYDVAGKLVKLYPVNANGKGSVTVNAAGMPSGVYLYTLVVNGTRTEMKKMLIAK